MRIPAILAESSFFSSHLNSNLLSLLDKESLFKSEHQRTIL